jgi:hypothetical protein
VDSEKHQGLAKMDKEDRDSRLKRIKRCKIGGMSTAE